MKKLALCSALALVSLHAAADVSPRFYAGLNIFAGSGTEHVEWYDDTTFDIDTDVSGSAIYGGYVFPSNNRFEISLTSISVSYDEGDDSDFSGIDFDWKFTLNAENVTPYLGVGFGLYTYEDTADVNKGGDLNGIALTLAAGVLAKIHERVELDIALSRKGIGWETAETELGDIQVSDGMTTLAFGAHYLF